MSRIGGGGGGGGGGGSRSSSNGGEDYYSSPRVLLVQLVSYISAFTFSLVVCVPMSIHQDHFKGHCLLFSTGEWQERDGQFKVDWASQAYCNFTIFVAVVTFILSVGFGARIVSYVRGKRDASFFAAFCEVLSNALLCVFALIAAVFVTVGFRVWCGEMTRRFEACSEAAGNPIDRADGIDSSQFYFHLTAATFGIWGCLVSAFAALVASVVKLCRYHHQENLRVSMAKERKRLINEDLVSEVPTRSGGGGGGQGGSSSSSSSGRRGRKGRSRSNKRSHQNQQHDEEDEEDGGGGMGGGSGGPFEEVQGREEIVEEGPDPSSSSSPSGEVNRIRGNQIRVDQQRPPEKYYDYR